MVQPERLVQADRSRQVLTYRLIQAERLGLDRQAGPCRKTLVMIYFPVYTGSDRQVFQTGRKIHKDKMVQKGDSRQVHIPEE